MNRRLGIAANVALVLLASMSRASEPIDYAADLGVGELAGEKDFSTLERRWARPTFDVNGLWSGYMRPP